jgi:hypothetical protein
LFINILKIIHRECYSTGLSQKILLFCFFDFFLQSAFYFANKLKQNGWERNPIAYIKCNHYQLFVDLLDKFLSLKFLSWAKSALRVHKSRNFFKRDKRTAWACKENCDGKKVRKGKNYFRKSSKKEKSEGNIQKILTK